MFELMLFVDIAIMLIVVAGALGEKKDRSERPPRFTAGERAGLLAGVVLIGAVVAVFVCAVAYTAGI